jgi:ethanolamine ammonia-lyase large subunit
MNRNSTLAVIVMVALALAANAHSISGKVSGGSGESVVYVDTIQGTNFPAPAEHAVMDQKDLLFQPHVLPAARSCSPNGNDRRFRQQ